MRVDDSRYSVGIQSVLAGLVWLVDEANHKQYGVSSTPTIVLLDRKGIVRVYHPGRMTAEELAAAIRRLL